VFSSENTAQKAAFDYFHPQLLSAKKKDYAVKKMGTALFSSHSREARQTQSTLVLPQPHRQYRHHGALKQNDVVGV